VSAISSPQPEQHFLNTEIEKFKTSSGPLTDIGASLWRRAPEMPRRLTAAHRSGCSAYSRGGLAGWSDGQAQLVGGQRGLPARGHQGIGRLIFSQDLYGELGTCMTGVALG
jgi:hypothetical protein